MKYKESKPSKALTHYIHTYWELKGEASSHHWERIFPDGCPGLIINLGDSCTTDNGRAIMEHGKTYVVGAMTTYKESFVSENTHLVGVCLQPAAFSSFFAYAPLSELKNNTVLFDRNLSFEKDLFFNGTYTNYLNRFFTERKNDASMSLAPAVTTVQALKGRITVEELAKQHGFSIRQLERLFNDFIGLTPKEYTNIMRLQNALNLIASQTEPTALLDIAFECGYYDHSHLTNAIKHHTGFLPSKL
ncbi:helix-turn-helix transcriptional regulator [Mesonia sp. K7]|uniref:helix-turn-helix transcriptional regulator n=1 Tax=Mesonia sp. K7 TaxID=2218606 RepID=UPI000DA6F5EC|nr:helix-turn-helix transcriptional regulator [Mesonia sp. K7]PZD76543.1 AraC family transcriptional regulator [Mesonia sp. K7]